MFVKAILKPFSLSVYLDDSDSVIDSIKTTDIVLIGKIYGENINCVKLTTDSNMISDKKSMSLCFTSDDDMDCWVTAIRHFKKCLIPTNVIESKKLLKDYNVMKFLVEQETQLLTKTQMKEKNEIFNSNSNENDQLDDLYYTINDHESKQDKLETKLFEKTLDNFMSKATVEKKKKKTESLIRKIKSGKYNETMSINGKNSTNTEVKRIQLISNNTNEILNNIDIIEKATKNLEETAELEREKMLKPKKRINSQIFEMKTRENEQISNHAQKFSIQILNKRMQKI